MISNEATKAIVTRLVWILNASLIGRVQDRARRNEREKHCFVIFFVKECWENKTKEKRVAWFYGPPKAGADGSGHERKAAPSDRHHPSHSITSRRVCDTLNNINNSGEIKQKKKQQENEKNERESFNAIRSPHAFKSRTAQGVATLTLGTISNSKTHAQKKNVLRSDSIADFKSLQHHQTREPWQKEQGRWKVEKRVPFLIFKTKKEY